MKNTGRQAWKNNFFFFFFTAFQNVTAIETISWTESDRCFFLPPLLLSLDGVTFSRAQLKNLWKKKHTHSLRRWRCLGLRITEVQIGSPCQNYSCTKDGTAYQPRAQKDFFRFSGMMQVLRKRSCAATSQDLSPPPPTLRWVSKDANLLKAWLKNTSPCALVI